ncbi:MAG TPA: VTT domain-containing protein [Devosiaceae bacterium]
MAQGNPDPSARTARGLARRLAPLAILVAAIALYFATGLDRLVSFDEIARQYGAMTDAVARQPVLAAGVAVAIYVVATAISIPAAWLFTVAMGLVFGWAVGTLLSVIGATIGASLLFLAARYALADFFRARAGNWLNRLAEGFREDAVSYLLFLRLVPAVPFTLLNVVPAILGVPFAIFFWTTLVGIVPGGLAFAFAGEGLRSIVSDRAAACAANVAPCGDPLRASDLLTPQILIAFLLLGVVSLLPLALRYLRRRGNGQ